MINLRFKKNIWNTGFDFFISLIAKNDSKTIIKEKYG